MPVSAEDRRRCLGVLARAEPHDLRRRWEALGLAPAFRHLRAPETGLVMVRGRIGGTGAPFNMGEMTVTRCSVRLASGAVGHGYAGGTDARHAEIVALCDALLQDEDHRAAVEREVVAPLMAARDAARQQTTARAAATKVEFFTVAREAGA
ncbi:MAG TPA: phosphonate C-P lyase system protein PhnG [Stellaceae bacterium]|nr:phosphonate C-P lyase system protein PhnG [Stellaceae bacterium]